MRYQQLDFSKYETRLLKLYPTSSGSSTKPVSCELIHGVSLIERPPHRPQYRALSYCWGDPSVTVPIIIDGRLVRVTENLRTALKEIGRTITIPSLLWVDALCINQADEYEKREQIQNMGTIFQNAERVIAWVGVPRTSQQANMAFIHFQGPSSVGELDELAAKAFSACVTSFGDAPFWRRAWIIQELAKAQKLDIRYGNLVIPWVKLKSALFSSSISPYLHGDFVALLQVLDQFQSRERQDRIGGRRRTLLEALFETRNSLATDPRDKIYALLGLASDGVRIIPAPNYVQRWNDVYTKAAENIVVGQGKIGAILLARRNDARKRFKTDGLLPSWVPNWATLSDCVSAPWIAKCIEHSTNANEVRTTLIGRAKAASDIPITTIDDSRSLRLPGMVHETINAVCATTSSTAKWRPDDTASQDEIDVRTFVWQLYDAINWTNAKDKDFSANASKKWTSQITDVSSLVGDKLHILGLTNSTLERFVEFLRLLLDEYDVDRKSSAFLRIQHWMQRNGSLKIGQATIREMLQEQLTAMQSFFSSRNGPEVNVIPPPAPQNITTPIEMSQSAAIIEKGRTMFATLPDRLYIRKSPTSSRRPSEEDISSRNEPDRTQIWMQPSSSLTLGDNTIRGMLPEKFLTLRSLLTNSKPPTNDAVAALASGIEKFDTAKMRLVVTGSRIRLVHEDADVGDQIAFLPNCPLPVVLRPVPGRARYRYVGEVYSESFARLFKDDFGDMKGTRWPDIWEVEGVKIERKEFLVIE